MFEKILFFALIVLIVGVVTYFFHTNAATGAKADRLIRDGLARLPADFVHCENGWTLYAEIAHAFIRGKPIARADSPWACCTACTEAGNAIETAWQQERANREMEGWVDQVYRELMLLESGVTREARISGGCAQFDEGLILCARGEAELSQTLSFHLGDCDSCLDFYTAADGYDAAEDEEMSPQEAGFVTDALYRA